MEIAGPSSDLLGGDGREAEPGCNGAPFTTSMSELDSDFLALTSREISDTLEGLDLAVFPEAQTLGRVAAPRQHARGLYNCEAGTALNDAAEVGEVPVVCVPVLGRILAERR